MLTANQLAATDEGSIWSPHATSAPRTKRRRKARLYILMAERHRARGDDPRIVAALVRAAWRAHEQADR